MNNHLQTIVFGSVIISNESEDTYVWFLEKFVEVMKGKYLKSIITN